MYGLEQEDKIDVYDTLMNNPHAVKFFMVVKNILDKMNGMYSIKKEKNDSKENNLNKKNKYKVCKFENENTEIDEILTLFVSLRENNN